jgi:hypothetical protein
MNRLLTGVSHLTIFTKKLLSGVSALAIAVGLGGTASASVSRDLDPAADVQENRIGVDVTQRGDPVIELMRRSGGQITAESVKTFLPTIFTPMTRDSAEALPEVMRNIRRMGLGSEVQEAALRTMSDLIAEAADGVLDEETATRLTIEIADEFAGPVQYAKVQFNPGTGKASDQGKANNNNNGRGNGTYTG